MKLYYTFPALALISGIFLTSCSNNTEIKEKNKNKLDVALINNPRSAENSNTDAIAEMPTMDFVDTAHDFGKLFEGETVSYKFVFKNNGKTPLLISNAAGSCGCTVPEYPREPIAPGTEAAILVKFNSANKIGLQNKTVNVFTNSTKGTHNLSITAEVMEK